MKTLFLSLFVLLNFELNISFISSYIVVCHVLLLLHVHLIVRVLLLLLGVRA